MQRISGEESDTLFLPSKGAFYGQIGEEKEQNNAYLNKADTVIIDEVKIPLLDIEPFCIHLKHPVRSNQVKKEPQQHKRQTKKEGFDQYCTQLLKKNVVTLVILHGHFSVSASPSLSVQSGVGTTLSSKLILISSGRSSYL